MTDENEEVKKNAFERVVPQWFYKLVFVVCSKLATWAMKKGNIKPDQHKKAEEGTKRIKDAANIPDTPVDVDNRDSGDLFNNDSFNN